MKLRQILVAPQDRNLKRTQSQDGRRLRRVAGSRRVAQELSNGARHLLGANPPHPQGDVLPERRPPVVPHPLEDPLVLLPNR
ncbi:hypothetical protein ACFL5M_04925 [Candidatus Neomarinimicrobiota bacterium]